MRNWLRIKLRAFLGTDQHLERRIAFLEETTASLELSIQSLIDAKIAPTDKEEEKPIRTPRPKAWHERRDDYIATRRDPDLIAKIMAGKQKSNAPKES